MIRQKPESYDPSKDSPLIGGYESKENIEFAAEPEVGWGPYVRTSDLIGLLEQAAEEFPESFFADYPISNMVFDEDEVNAWKRKWLTVPPV